MVISADGLFALPPDADPRQLAMLAINPPTAALLLSEYVNLKPGEWVVQNAANSGVGRWVIAFAKRRGLKTVNIVRRPELVPELEAIGGDVVVVESPDVSEKIKAAVGHAEVRLALETVIDIFGPDRLVFGSDWPVVNLVADYGKWVDVVDAALKHMTPADQQKVWASNAERFYGL